MVKNLETRKPIQFFCVSLSKYILVIGSSLWVLSMNVDLAQLFSVSMAEATMALVFLSLVGSIYAYFLARSSSKVKYAIDGKYLVTQDHRFRNPRIIRREINTSANVDLVQGLYFTLFLKKGRILGSLLSGKGARFTVPLAFSSTNRDEFSDLNVVARSIFGLLLRLIAVSFLVSLLISISISYFVYLQFESLSVSFSSFFDILPQHFFIIFSILFATKIK